MSYADKLLVEVNRGKEGLNIGISMGLPRLEEHIYGLTKETYTVLFGNTGGGKTSVALYAYIYRPLMEMIKEKKDFKIIYFSLEMTGVMLLAKLASIYILETYGIQIGYKEIFSKKTRISEDHYKLVVDAIKWTKTIEEYFIIYDKTLSSKSLYSFLKSHAEDEGTFEIVGNSEFYVPNNPEQIRLIVTDHIGLVRRTDGRTKKEEIDLCSSYLLWFRNKCKYAILVLMQVNRGQNAMDRRSANLLEPTLEDIKDTGAPSEDAEIVIGIFNPFKEKLMKHRSYDIKQLRDNVRFLCLLKNRYGEVQKVIPISFYGKVNYVKELPELNGENDDSNLDYSIFNNPLWVEDNISQTTAEKPMFVM